MTCLHNNAYIHNSLKQVFSYSISIQPSARVMSINYFTYYNSTFSRNCIGQVFAANEVKVVTAKLLQRYVITHGKLTHYTLLSLYLCECELLLSIQMHVCKSLSISVLHFPLPFLYVAEFLTSLSVNMYYKMHQMLRTRYIVF